MRKLFFAVVGFVVLVAMAACVAKTSAVTRAQLDEKRSEIDLMVKEAMAVGGEVPRETVDKVNGAFEELQAMSLRFVEANFDNAEGADVFVGLNTTGSGNIVAQQEMWDTWDKFSDEMKARPGMLEFKKSMDAQRALEAKFGGRYLEIVSTSPEGAEVRLSDVVKANKYTLVDFWASWCGPCLRELPSLKEAYSEFHGAGFEIFGVTLDDDGAAWRAAIKEHGMTWPQVGSVMGWSEPAAVAYGVRSIPASWLVDGEGNIVARNLRGEAVSDKLRELLK